MVGSKSHLNKKNSNLKFINNPDVVISIMKQAGEWMENTNKHPSKWWKPENMNEHFLMQYAEPGDLFVGMAGDEPAISAILQFDERNQSWESVDGNEPKKALYVHWLCVNRNYAGKGYPEKMINFATKIAREKKIKYLRVDTTFSKKKLRKIYEDLGFSLAGTLKESYRTTAFYQKELG
ncbi:MAG TPA: GNAT family N-acetyltransferase [Patescibacteria group bacterium]|nr:GNAT family N-acetyltransferase [Patescibacteria group bacterium]